MTGRADLSRAVCAGQYISVDQPMTADNGITSRHTTPRRRYTQLRGNGSDYDDMLAHSQFDNSSVCTLGDGKNDFLHCNDDDDSRIERTFSRTITAGLGSHPLGRSHSQPPPVRGLVSDSQGTIANYRSEMRTSGTENVDNSLRPRPAQPQPIAWGLDRHQRSIELVNQGVQPGNLQSIDKLSGSDVLLAHTSALQRQDTLPWPPGQGEAPRTAYTQLTHPARKSVAAMQAGDALPGPEDVPMPTHRSTGAQMDFRQQSTIPVSTQQVSCDDHSPSTRLPQVTGVHTESLTVKLTGCRSQI